MEVTDKTSLLHETDPPQTSSRFANINPRKQRIFLTFCIFGIFLACGIIIVIVVVVSDSKEHQPSIDHPCADASQRLIQLSKSSRAYEKLAEMADTFGPRLSGTSNLEQAISWVQQKMVEDGLENVRTENVYVPTWVRGNESAVMLQPRYKKLGMLGLGGSIATPPEGITGEVLMVTSFDNLKANCAAAAGKIVLFNPVWEGYGVTVQYRSGGAKEAAKCGAIASLVKSIGPYSLYTPHTGSMSYEKGVTQIPAAAITLEDAEMISRMTKRNQTVQIQLYMEAQFLNDSLSRNVMGEVTGQNPNEVIVIGGHIDSWDVGQGAMDDGGGVTVSWEAVRMILQYMKETGQRPLRTVRIVGWTNEENGARGGQAYRDLHLNETHVWAFESDGGVTAPVGIGFTGLPAAKQILVNIGKLLSSVGSTQVLDGGGGVDINPLINDGVPGSSLEVNREKYFWYHHTQADTMDKLDPQEMQNCVATMAVFSYCVATHDTPLPRK